MRTIDPVTLRRLSAQSRLDAPTTVGYDKQLPDVFGFTEGKRLKHDPDERSPAKPLVELEMTRLSAELRRKPSWWNKCRNEVTLREWREEALAQAKHMNESHVDYVLKELEGYANLRDKVSGVEVSCYDKIWQSDTLIPTALKEQLIVCVAKLEDIPESEKNWRPGSNGQILDLVHPSLYPIVYDRTLSYPIDSDDRSPTALQLRLKPPKQVYRLFWSHSDYYISKRFQWLPTDFEVSEDGTSVKSLSYINNIHPLEHEVLHKAIEGLVGAQIPLFERVLTDSIPKNEAVPERTLSSGSYDWNPHKERPIGTEYSDAQKYIQDYAEWEKGLIMAVPHTNKGGYLPGSLEKRCIRYNLGGRTIQVIVKLTNIHLTPENPEYGGGSWRVEGMLNEAIAASSIYCYNEENVTESRLAFRTAVAPPNYYESDDKGCILTWGMGRGDPCINKLGSVVSSPDRCIAFPNTYQHRVSPFELADKSKPGHRKIVALFLIDPAVRLQSTTVVPPQQQEWRASGISANPALKAGFDKLSPELINNINTMAGGVMNREEAEAYRLELRDERTVFVEKNTKEYFMVPLYLSSNDSEPGSEDEDF